MLSNLTDRISFTIIEEQAISHLLPHEKSQWETKIVKVKHHVDIVKERVRSELNRFQKNCVYCGARLWDSSNPEIEHIAPKWKYPEFMYCNTNLVYSCHLCNGFFMKGKTDTITDYDEDYKKCKFKIVHPYFDDFKDHFSYTLPTIDKLVIVPLSPQAVNSVEIFDLNSIPRVEARGKRFIAENISIKPEDEERLRRIVEYKIS